MIACEINPLKISYFVVKDIKVNVFTQYKFLVQNSSPLINKSVLDILKNSFKMSNVTVKNLSNEISFITSMIC